MKISKMLGPLGAIIAFITSATASAEGPAVSETNGKFSLEGGAVGNSSNGSSGLGIAQGSLTTPLGQSFGLQFDGVAATAYNNFFGGGDAQFFWRDPKLGLLGAFASVGGGRGNTVSWYGGAAEYFAGAVTLGAHAGYQVVYSNTAGNGGFGAGHLTYYPIANLALSGGGGVYVNSGYGRATIEYQPELNGQHSMSFFVNGGAGSNAAYAVTAGVRFYFGPEKTLIRRHREDDPTLSTIPYSSGFVVGTSSGSGGDGGRAGLLGGSYGGGIQ